MIAGRRNRLLFSYFQGMVWKAGGMCLTMSLCKWFSLNKQNQGAEIHSNGHAVQLLVPPQVSVDLWSRGSAQNPPCVGRPDSMSAGAVVLLQHLKIDVGHLTLCGVGHSPVPRVTGVGSNRQHSPGQSRFPMESRCWVDVHLHAPLLETLLQFCSWASSLWKAQAAGVYGNLVVCFCKKEKVLNPERGLKVLDTCFS